MNIKQCRGLWAVLCLATAAASGVNTSGRAAEGGSGAIIWGVQPVSGQIIKINPVNGSVLGSFAAPTGLQSTHREIGLSIAQGGQSLLYINTQVNHTLYRLDPDSGVQLSTHSMGSWQTDGLSYESVRAGENVTDLIFTSHSNVDLHRKVGFGGSESFFWAAGASRGAVGGDDNGREFAYFTDGKIHEYAPYTDTNTFLSTLTPPASDIEGLAFDGVNLYASTASGLLYTLNPDTGVVTHSIEVPGGALYGLGAHRGGDLTPPQISCPPDVTQANDTNQCGAFVVFPPPVATDDAGPVSVACEPTSGSFFPMGTTTVLCTATDAAGNTATCTFKVIVRDTQRPQVAVPSNRTVDQQSARGAVVDYIVNASDNCPGVNTSAYPPSGSVFPLGSTVVSCTATDAAGNTATRSFTITVMPPASTPGRVFGSGRIRIEGGTAELAVSVRVVAGRPTGEVTLRTPRGTLRTLRLTAAVFSRGHAKVFGRMRTDDRPGEADFVADLEDGNGTPDWFSLETTSQSYPLTSLYSGSISVQP